MTANHLVLLTRTLLALAIFLIATHFFHLEKVDAQEPNQRRHVSLNAPHWTPQPKDCYVAVTRNKESFLFLHDALADIVVRLEYYRPGEQIELDNARFACVPLPYANSTNAHTFSPIAYRLKNGTWKSIYSLTRRDWEQIEYQPLEMVENPPEGQCFLATSKGDKLHLYLEDALGLGLIDLNFFSRGMMVVIGPVHFECVEDYTGTGSSFFTPVIYRGADGHLRPIFEISRPEWETLEPELQQLVPIPCDEQGICG